MNNLKKDFMDENGNINTMIAESDDSEKVSIDGGVTLVGYQHKKDNKFRNTLLGAEIGHKSGGFTSVLGLALVIAVAVFIVLYFVWKF